MTRETRLQQGKLWKTLSKDKQAKFPGMENDYNNFKEEIDKELGLNVKPKEEVKKTSRRA